MKLLRILSAFFSIAGLHNGFLISDVLAGQTLVLPSNQWHQISLPGSPPPNNNTVKTIFGDDINGVYGTDWVVFSFNPETDRYINPGLNGVLKQGVGYWIHHSGENNVILDLPVNMSLGAVSLSSQCVSDHGCFEVELTTQQNAKQWLLLGNPFETVKVFLI